MPTTTHAAVAACRGASGRSRHDYRRYGGPFRPRHSDGRSVATAVLVAAKILSGSEERSDIGEIPALGWLNGMKKHGAPAVLVDHAEEIQELRASLGD